MNKRYLTTLVSTALLAVPFSASGGTYFSFTDNDGTVHFSDERPETDYPVQEISFHETFRTAIKKLSRSELKRMISGLSTEYNVEPALVEAIVKAESEYDANAVSKTGARGLMQLMPATARSLGVFRIHDPEE